jgi:hypothetical protein
MEVHAHTHTARKKWTHYFWEFLMLFLAVFCGFLAENKREHMIEHQREKQYMITLLEDLKRDTAQFVKMKIFLVETTGRKDSIISYTRPPIKNDNILKYYREVAFITSIGSYAYNDRTIEQLRQSGNFRLIRKRTITDSLTKYDNRMRNVFARNYDVLWDNRIKLNDELNKIIDNTSYEYVDGFTGEVMEDSLKLYKLWPMQLLTHDEKTLTAFYNGAMMQRGYMLDFLSWVDRMYKSAINLILLIEKEYHLD